MKIVLKIIINLFIFSFLIFILEIFFLCKDYQRIYKNVPKEYRKPKIEIFCNYIKQFYNPTYFSMDSFRRPYGLEYHNKPSIIILGCSYAYGLTLKDEDTFHYILSKYIKRPVYNYSVSAASPREMLYLLRNKILFKKFMNVDENNVQYVFYTYMPHQKTRLFADIYKRSPTFQIINDSNLEYIKPKPFENLYLYRKIQTYKAEKNSLNDKNFDLLCLYINEIKKEATKLFNNSGKQTKFILLVYSDDNTDNWQKLEKNGIRVIKLNEITDADINSLEYQVSENDTHPNNKVWHVIVPALIKKLKLNN